MGFIRLSDPFNDILILNLFLLGISYVIAKIIANKKNKK